MSPRSTRTIGDLEDMFHRAMEQDLIMSFEPIKNRDYFVIRFKPGTSEKTKQTLKVHIRETYKNVFFVTTGGPPHEDYLYIRYSVYDE